MSSDKLEKVSWSYAAKLEVWVSVAYESVVWMSTAMGYSGTSGFVIRRAKARLETTSTNRREKISEIKKGE